MTNIDSLLNTLKSRDVNILGYESFGKYAVLLPLIKREGEWCLLFEVRSSKLKHQPGEICFPGGKVEIGETFEQAAIRETCEELGIHPESIEHVVAIDYFVSPYGKIIYPFVAKVKEDTTFMINEEVAEIFFVPLAYLENYNVQEYTIQLKVEVDELFPMDKIVGGKDYQWQKRRASELFYEYEGKTIWGLTARILSHFLSLKKS